MHKFEELLKKYSRPPEGIGTSVIKKIKEFRKLESLLTDAKKDLPTIKSANKKANLEQQIQEAEEGLFEMDADICHSIERYERNKDVYSKNASRLKNTGKSAPANDPAPPVDDPAPPPANDPAPSDKNDDSNDKNKDKKPKKKSGWGIVIGAVGILAAIVIGKNIMENR